MHVHLKYAHCRNDCVIIKRKSNQAEEKKTNEREKERASERRGTKNARGRECDITGVSKRLGARVIRVIAVQLHYLINPGGRNSRQSPRRGGRDCPARGAIAIIIV